MQNATCAGAQHLRDRYFFVAYANSNRCNKPDSFVLKGRQDPAHCAPAWSLPGADLERVECPDGKARLREPGIDLLADGHPAKLAQLRALGNAINTKAAEIFIRCVMSSLP